MSSVGLGVKVGLTMGGLLAAYVVVVHGFGGATGLGGSPSRLAASYLVGGAVGGVIVDVLGTRVRSRAAAAALGVIVAMPMTIGFAMVSDLPGPARFSGAIVTAVIIGGPCGVLFFDFITKQLGR